MDDVIYRKDAAKILCNWCGVCPEDKRDIMNCDDICPEFAKIPSAQQWIPPRRCIDCENFNKTQLLVPQPQQKQWIPCNKRLPKELVPVNVTWVNKDPEPYYSMIKDKPFTDTAVYYEGKWYWQSATCVDLLKEYGESPADDVAYGIEIVAWMPLPSPYREEVSE